MGEAKRRKKLNPDYGKFPLLRTARDREKHIEQIVDDLRAENKAEMIILTHAKEFPDNYQQIHAQFAEWLENRLSKYHERDREIIASNLLVFFILFYRDYEITPLILLCFSDILKSYFSSDLSEKMKVYIKEVFPNLEAKFGYKIMS